MRFDPPEMPSGGILASPFLTSSSRTRRAAFTAMGSPVSVSISLSNEQDLRIARPAPSLVKNTSTCSPSSCLRRYPEHLATTRTPSPSDSRLEGDPALTRSRTLSVFRRLVRFLTPFITGYSPERALRPPYNYERIHRCHRFRYAAMGDVFHRWKLRFNQCRLHHAHRTCGTS